MKENWKDIEGYKGMYQISDLGRVKSLWHSKERILKAGVSSSGYLTVSFYKDRKAKTYQVHQLVAIAFRHHIINGRKMVVNHINFNKLDNRAINLESVTFRENSNHKHIKSSSQYTGVSWHKVRNKWIATIYIKGADKHLGYFVNELDASKAYEQAIQEVQAEIEQIKSY